jgi:translation initiation factor 4A
MTEVNADNTKSNADNTEYDNFDEMECIYTNEPLLKGIMGFGFEQPSPIQSKAITNISRGLDVIAQAQSGTGKTGAFSIGVLTLVDPNKKYPQAIIMANTKELAIQIHHVISSLAINLKLTVNLCIGGVMGKNSSINLKESYQSHILVCTPGRLIDLMERDDAKKNKIRLLDGLRIMVCDEADALLEKDFLPQIQNIIKKIPRDCQICLFSATYSDKQIEMTKSFMNNPYKILVPKDKLSVDLIRHYKVNTRYEEYKYDVLSELYKEINICQAIIFVNSIKRAIELSERLSADKHTVGTIHSELSDIERSDILKEFRTASVRVLVTTDIIGRGIDVQRVGLVINYDMPNEPQQYIHRVGRTGRMKKSGVAINFVTANRNDRDKICERDVNKLFAIESEYNIRVDDLPQLEYVNNYLTGMNGYSIDKSTE